MSGATNQWGSGRGGWGASPWGPGAWNQQGGPQTPPQGGPNQGGPWANNAYAWWSISRPLMIAGTIIGFMLWWPIGLVMLCVAIWNKKMGRAAFGYGPAAGGPGPNGWSNAGSGGGWSPPWMSWKSWCCGGNTARGVPPSSGNHAFDEYRNQTLQRLEEEQREFSAFLERLRFARDKAEFDQFMNERRQPPATTNEPPTHQDN
jgi:hypothetical protein